jgi:hypothetical protein
MRETPAKVDPFRRVVREPGGSLNARSSPDRRAWLRTAARRDRREQPPLSGSRRWDGRDTEVARPACDRPVDLARVIGNVANQESQVVEKQQRDVCAISLRGPACASSRRCSRPAGRGETPQCVAKEWRAARDAGDCFPRTDHADGRARSIGPGPRGRPTHGEAIARPMRLASSGSACASSG